MATPLLTHLLRLLAITLAVALLPGIAAAQEGTTIKDEGRIAYASNDTGELFAQQERTVETETYREDVQRPPDRAAPVPREQRTTTVQTTYEETRSVHWLWVVGRNAILGGAVGAVVGTGAYLLSGFEWDPLLIPQFTGGGILFGTAIGLIDVAFREDVFAARPSSIDWIERDMPATMQIRLFRTEF